MRSIEKINMGNDFFTGGYNKKEQKNNEILSIEAPVTRMRKAGNKIATWLVNNHAGLLSIVLLGFAILVMLTDNLNLKGVFWQKVVSPETLLLATCSYLLYLNSYTIGHNVAGKTEFCVNVDNAYTVEVGNIRAKRIEWMLELFCVDYRKKELEYTKTDILICAGFSEKQVKQIIAGEFIVKDDHALTKEQVKALAKANALKPIKLNKNMLVNARNEHIDRSPIRSAGAIEAEKYRAFITKLLTIIISFTFVVSLSISLIQDFGAEAILSALFQLALMLISLFGGMSLGFRIKTKYTERLQDVIGVLYEFNEWLERRKTTEKAETTAQNEG